jgi:hypothetical protein
MGRLYGKEFNLAIPKNIGLYSQKANIFKFVLTPIKPPARILINESPTRRKKVMASRRRG